MGTLEFLGTEDGALIVTEGGAPIEVSVATNNGGIQVFDFSVDLLRALLWQYNNAANLQSLLAQKQAWYDENQQQFWQDWYNNVFNLATANAFGLTVWAIILGVKVFTNPPDEGPIFGFDTSTGFNFDNGIFGDNESYQLSEDDLRILLQLRYFQLVSSGTVPETNRMLKYVFGKYGKAWLQDFGNMSQRYVFDFPVPFGLSYIFNNYDVLPRPAGVMSGFIDATVPCFGCALGDLNFDNGIFGG